MPATLFDMPTNTTTEARGSNLALVKTTGHATKITLTLAVLADWMKLTQFLILKRKDLPKEKLLGGMTFKYAENEWMTGNFKVEWLREFWHT